MTTTTTSKNNSFFMSKTTPTLLSTFLGRPLHYFDVKLPNATFYGDRDPRTTKPKGG